MSHYFPSPPTSPTERKRKRSVSPSPHHHHNNNNNNNNDEQQLPRNNKQVKLDPTLLERYLTTGGSPNIRDAQRGFSLLCWACYSKSESALRLLLRQEDLDPNTTHGPDRSTALHIAASVGFSNGIQQLLHRPKRNINIHALDQQGQTPLHRAVTANQPACVQILLQAGARVDQRNVMEECVVGGCASILSELLAKVNKKKEEERQRHQGQVEGKGEKRKQQNNNNNKQKNKNLIPLAVFWNRIECLELLLGAGFNSNDDDDDDERNDDVGTQQQQQQNKQVTETITTTTTTDPTINNDSPLYRAVQQRKLDMVRCLIRHANASPCLPNGNNPSLLYAASHGFLDMIPLLLTHDTSSDCIRQAVLLAEPLGLSDAVAHIIRQQQVRQRQNGIY
ncbi:ankyrin repeat-containing domain protein [Zychaea mexicana]|uniref:ankyrin repeat-containing domain protein n=1 Tax=Zychaea mexicana TaxID=64656 RepID=UPI0022FE5CF9|nr:ankyrin repeat-containing domain protein [Zychaea mexicana]KAI9488839.1 ankyrin repeat-containing domain protein [Zychaea mexicana]